MKRIIALLLIVVMLLGLTGCAALQEKAQQKLEEQLAALPYGEISGSVYASEKAGLYFAKPTGWRFLTKEEIESLKDESAEADAPVMDMFAMDATTGERVVIMYQVSDMGDSVIMESVYSKLLEKILETTLEEKPEFDKAQKVMLGQTEFHKLRGVTQSGLQTVYLHIEEEYISMILIQAKDDQTLEKLEAQFGKDAADAAAKVDKAPFAQGSYEGETYKSEFSSLNFEKPADWDYMSSSEMANEMGLAGNALSAENYSQTYVTEGYIYDMAAGNAASGASVYVCYESPAMSGMADADAATYLQSFKNELLADEETTYTVKTEDTATLSGQSYRRILFTGDYDGVTVYQGYYVRRIDGEMSMVIITALSETELAEVEKMFI